MRNIHPFAPGLTALAVLLAMPGQAATLAILPDFSTAIFTPGATLDNRFLPFGTRPSLVLEARGTEADGTPFVERDVASLGDQGPVILGVQTTKVVDRAFDNGLLSEETSDFYAQDTVGNVWYMGEDATSYYYDDAGNLTGTDTHSSWRAGVNGGLPGFAMLADPKAGDAYYQEFSPADGAVDEGLVLAFLDSLDIGGITYRDVLRVFETSSLDPALREIKYYASNVGLFHIEEGVDADYLNPGRVFSPVAAVPLPASLPMLAGAVALLSAVMRRRRA